MVTTLRVIVDAILDPASRGASRYAEELTRALIAHAPRGCAVEGIVSASPEHEYEELRSRLPGLAGLTKSSLARRELTAAWRHGITPGIGGGMIHSPALLAPLRRHDRRTSPGEQTVVTVHDGIALLDPALASRRATADLAMLKRAERHADAVVVPSNVLADVLAERTSLAGRLRVIPGGVSPTLLDVDDAAERRERLGLDEPYVFTLATLGPRKGLDRLLAAVPALETPLVIGGDPSWNGRTIDEALAEAGVDSDRVRVLGVLDDRDLAAAYAGAVAFAHPGRHEGFGLPVLEAFALATPVVISDDPALVEVADGAARIVGEKDDWADALRAVTEESDETERLVVAGGDRSRAFSWRDAAASTWQLHADL